MRSMIDFRATSVIALLAFAGPALALGPDDVTGGTLGITDRIEQQARQTAERALERRIQKQATNQVRDLQENLAALPDRLAVTTADGQTAFHEVRLDTGERVVERQWLATGNLKQDGLFDQPGITVLDQQRLDGLGMTVVRLQVSSELDSRKALQSALPNMVLDRNHVYRPQNDRSNNPAPEKASDDIAPQQDTVCAAPTRIGMIDTGIATDHPALQTTKIIEQSFLDTDQLNQPLTRSLQHGTAVASRLVNAGRERETRSEPAVTLFNASVFYQLNQTLSGATLGHLLQGLNWLADQAVPVINISLTGPGNDLLAFAVEQLHQQGIVMVAAVGNQGPASAPLYPAAYPEVIGVTAVDRTGKLYRWANRGDQVMFAAEGVSVSVAHPRKGQVVDSGTSLATPLVASALACRLVTLSPDAAIADLIASARDLGEPDRDPLFGHGLVSVQNEHTDNNEP